MVYTTVLYASLNLFIGLGRARVCVFGGVVSIGEVYKSL